MSALFRHPLRVSGRLIWMVAEFAFAALNFVFRYGRNSSSAQRALWLQDASRRLLRIFKTTIHTTGTIPTGGLLASNHLSYVDILVISSITPAIFVAKHEVKGWPVFGWFAKMAGTLFVDRERRLRAGDTTTEMQTALDQGALVVLFPEGTSSNGQTVLPFKSSLLEPATRQLHALYAGVVQYRLEDGDVGEELCYWQDVTLMSHLINLLSKKTIHASVSFTQLREGSTDRKELAKQLHSEVLRMKEFVPF